MQVATTQVMRVSDIVENDNIFSLFKWHLGVSEIPPWEIPVKTHEPSTHNVPIPQFSKKQFSHPLNIKKGFEYIKSIIGGICKVVSNLPEAIPANELPGKGDSLIPSLDLAFEFNRIGLLHCRADLLLTRISKSHIIMGPSILEDVIGVIFYDKNVDLSKKRKYSSKVFRKCFVYTIICSLLREKQIPIYMSSFGNLFIKSTLTITSKGLMSINLGIFAINYSYLNSDEFVKDVGANIKSKSNSTSNKLNAALCQLKSDLLPPRKRFYPFLLESKNMFYLANDTHNENEKKIKKKKENKGSNNNESTVVIKTKPDESGINSITKESDGCDSWDESTP